MKLRELFGSVTISPSRDRRSHHACIETLESRIAPANISVTVIGHLLKIVADNDNNSITIDGSATDTMQFQVSSGSDTLNHLNAPFIATGITDISVKLLGGKDDITFTDTNPIFLHGSLTINGGTGDNTVNTASLLVGKNLTIHNGLGKDTNSLNDLNVHGSVLINDGSGGSVSNLLRTSSGGSLIGGNLTIINGVGADQTTIGDTDVGGNLTVASGAPDAGNDAGFTTILNLGFKSGQSLYRRNIDLSFNGGIGTAELDDAVVSGNLTFAYGATGSFTTTIDSILGNLPVAVHGNVTLTSGGVFGDPLKIGVTGQKLGLHVNKNFTVTTGAGQDSLTIAKLQVGGNTSINTGLGADQLTLDDSTFEGTFQLNLGTHDSDNFILENQTGTTLPTIFEKPVTIHFGGGGLLEDTGTSDDGEELRVWDTFVVHGHVTHIDGTTHEVFPFGNTIVFES
ncbi:MAG: hypothetical protein QOD99_2908 [Chthoniobacter sp.]|jgi:hypothetical protein|nr:hypothetical protein [Chthoniobacter sp.]